MSLYFYRVVLNKGESMQFKSGKWARGVLLCPKCESIGPHYPAGFVQYEGENVRKVKCFNRSNCSEEFLSPPPGSREINVPQARIVTSER